VNAPSNKQLARLLREMMLERQQLLIREANYLRQLVGLPPVRADGERKGEGERRGR
jgi:hypothetical protein